MVGFFFNKGGGGLSAKGNAKMFANVDYSTGALIFLSQPIGSLLPERNRTALRRRRNKILNIICLETSLKSD